MLFFRSEAHLERWLSRHRLAQGAVMPLTQIRALADAWYGNRLDPGFAGWTYEEAVSIFQGVGLAGDFWE